ncbi:MAG: E2 ligase fold family C protein [Usitatibacteraceae bacterium]
MGHADYFSRNATSAAQLLKDASDLELKATLESHWIGIAFDAAAATTNEGVATLDLLVRLVARFYPQMIFVPMDAKAEVITNDLEQLALQINPNLSITRNRQDVTICVVVGDTAFRATRGARKIYVGSDGWIAKISHKLPRNSRNTNNPFGAGVAACLAAANLFRMVFKKQLSFPALDTELERSVFDLNCRDEILPNPAYRAIDVGRVHVVGMGAIGNGFIWAIKNSRVKGEFDLIDHELIDLGNLQRYVMAVRSDETADKVMLAVTHMTVAGRILRAHKETWKQYLQGQQDWKFEKVVVAVDNRDDRIDIQAALPKWIVNGWTQPGVAGFSRHASFEDENACLACLYVPTGAALNEDQKILSELGLDSSFLMAVRTLLERSEGLKQDFLAIIANANNIPLEKLMPYEGKSLRSLYVDGICGGALLEFMSKDGRSQAEVPMAFQSVLSGIMLAAELVMSNSRSRLTHPNIGLIDLLRVFPEFPLQHRLKQSDGHCMCSDEDYLQVYREKYSTH